MAQTLQAHIERVASRVHASIRNNPDVCEAFLCGGLILDMLQPLQGSKVQNGWPARLRGECFDCRNGGGDIVYAFNLCDEDDSSLLYAPTALRTHDSNGARQELRLSLPTLRDPRNMASILATAILRTPGPSPWRRWRRVGFWHLDPRRRFQDFGSRLFGVQKLRGTNTVSNHGGFAKLAAFPV